MLIDDMDDLLTSFEGLLSCAPQIILRCADQTRPLMLIGDMDDLLTSFEGLLSCAPQIMLRCADQTCPLMLDR